MFAASPYSVTDAAELTQALSDIVTVDNGTGIIDLTADIDYSSTIDIDYASGFDSVTINLNGFNLDVDVTASPEDIAIEVQNGATLTVNGTGSLTAAAFNANAVYVYKSTLSVNSGGELTAIGESALGEATASVYVTDGTLSMDGSSAIYVQGFDRGVYAYDGAVATVTSVTTGDPSTDDRGVYANGSEIIVMGDVTTEGVNRKA